MKKHLKILIWTSIILAFINIFWLGYNSYLYLDIPAWFEIPETYVMFIFIGLLVLFFSHLIISTSVILSLKRSHHLFIPGIILLILGAVSFSSLFFHWGCLTDILKEFPLGLEVKNEIKIIWICHIFHASFILYSLFYLFNIKKTGNRAESTPGLLGEQLFISLNLIGIVCGGIGLFIVFVDFYFNVHPQMYKWVIIPYSLFVLIPYLLILAGWFIQALADKKSGWYDEKQKSDIFKSGTVTLLVSIPAMLLLFIFNYNDITGTISILWMPFYLFGILLVFSFTALYSFMKN